MLQTIHKFFRSCVGADMWKDAKTSTNSSVDVSRCPIHEVNTCTPPLPYISANVTEHSRITRQAPIHSSPAVLDRKSRIFREKIVNASTKKHQHAERGLKIMMEKSQYYTSIQDYHRRSMPSKRPTQKLNGLFCFPTNIVNTVRYQPPQTYQ